MGKKAPQDLILWFFLALFFVSMIMLGRLLWPFVSIIVLAAVVTGIFSPVYNFVKIEDKVRPSLASLITCLIIFCILFIPILLFVGILSKEAYDLYLTAKGAVLDDQLKNLLEGSRVLEKINLFLTNFNLELSSEDLNSTISQIGKVVGLFLYNQARAVASNMLNFFVNFFLMLLIIYFLLIDSGKLVKFIVSLSPLPNDQDTRLIDKFKGMAGSILIINGIGGLIQGLLGGIVFALFGLKSPFLWGVIMSLLAFLPILGVGLVFIPAAIFLFLKGSIGAGIFFVIFYLVLSTGVEYLLKPRLVGKRVQMHTLLVFLSIMGGLKLFGILGIIYGPLTVTAFLTLTEIYRANYQEFVEPNCE